MHSIHTHTLSLTHRRNPNLRRVDERAHGADRCRLAKLMRDARAVTQTHLNRRCRVIVVVVIIITIIIISVVVVVVVVACDVSGWLAW